MGHAEHIYFDKDKEEAQKDYIFNFIYEPLFDDGGEVYGIFVEAMDYSKQITYQEELEKSLKEKETLLAEIHHRVKNNLAIVTSMMQLQAMETEDIDLQGALRSAQQRIQTIATIQELLYDSESLSHLNFGENVRQLLNNLRDIYGSEKQITVDLQIEDIPMNINQAIPCALMVNEVVTNAYKHAFNNKKEGEIGVSLYEQEKKVVVEVTDNGVGIPDNLIQEDSSTIGMTLINLLKQQLGGDVQFSNKNGTQFKLEFEKADVKGIGSSLVED